MDISDLYDDDDYVPSESDLSHVIRRAERQRKIEVFSGKDPMFNIANLVLRVKMLTRV